MRQEIIALPVGSSLRVTGHGASIADASSRLIPAGAHSFITARVLDAGHAYETAKTKWLKKATDGKKNTWQTMKRALNGIKTRISSKSLPLHISDRIPLEVFEVIIDYMPISTLLNAVLVCHAWHSRASRHLYSTVVIKSRTQYDLLVEQSRTSPRVKQWLATTRDLVVLCSYNSKREGISFLNSLPLVFAHTLPALRVLDIRRMLCYNMHPTFYHALRHFTHIMSLRLDDAVLGNVAQLRRIVCAFPHLEDLALDRVTFRQPHYAVASPPRHRLDTSFPPESNIVRLKALTISAHPNAGPESFISQAGWLVSSVSCVSLRDLAVCVLCKDDLNLELACEQVNRLLEASGPSLISFHRIYDFWHGQSSLELTRAITNTKTIHRLSPGQIQPCPQHVPAKPETRLEYPRRQARR
ncbi:uncharacterized protein B0H18DRAFT_332864 [Fomitopsis serialis]|uniref:uncharacterized protein n=1 Tax=Fomitopsis serialis TaxID=139415 RepID=UPI0020085F33|nr:uncharacterized protein B0H18DRAFT_332864 [Neoantrodia serialis]KAH9926786.1 hypothetical protein B0H18DRAFT_332864 [Neoantrodia serialis]